MARGWESKAVEAQQEDARGARTHRAPLTPDQRLALERRRTLQLARARTVADLSRSTLPAHRSMLERALQDIDKQLAQLPREDTRR